MNQIIDSWIHDMLTRSGPILNNGITVVGEWQKYLMERASATLTIAPACAFCTNIDSIENRVSEKIVYAEFFIFGVLDILSTSDKIKLSRISIQVSQLIIDPVISSGVAFRHAGRDAALKFLEIIEKNEENGERMMIG